VTRTIEPNSSQTEIYDFAFSKYTETYERLKDLMHEMADRT